MAAQVRIQQLRAAEALEDCRAALRLDPAHQKTLSRMARASEEKTPEITPASPQRRKMRSMPVTASPAHAGF